MSESYVLDSFAVLTLLNDEPGSDQVAALLRQAQAEDVRLLMTWINVGEVAYIVERRWGERQMYEALAMLEATALEIVAVDRELALAAARIKAAQPIAYADAFAAALAQRLGATLVTGDPEFKQLEGALDVHWLLPR